MKYFLYLMIGFVALSCLSDFSDLDDEPVNDEFVKVPLTPHKEDIGVRQMRVDSSWFTYSPNGDVMELMRIKMAEKDSFINIGDQVVYNFVRDCPTEYVYDPLAEAIAQCPFPKFYIDREWDTLYRRFYMGNCIPFYWEKDTVAQSENLEEWKPTEYQDTGKSYIGNHVVMSYLGRGGIDFDTTKVDDSAKK
jgi:hypothetical protein